MNLAVKHVPEDIRQLLIDTPLPTDVCFYEVEGRFIFPVTTENGLAPAAFVYVMRRGKGEPDAVKIELGHIPGEIVYHGHGWMTIGVEFKLSDSFHQKREKLLRAIRALGGQCQ